MSAYRLSPIYMFLLITYTFHGVLAIVSSRKYQVSSMIFLWSYYLILTTCF
jgi:hypothetical protein